MFVHVSHNTCLCVIIRPYPGTEGFALTEILILNVSWMRKYKGLKNDVPVGKFKFLTSGGVPHEIFNFLPYKGRCYGSAPVRNGTVNITKLGASEDASEVSNILVVWTAGHPGGGRFVVGW